MTAHTRRDEVRAAMVAMLMAPGPGDYDLCPPELRGDLIDRVATLRMRLGIARGVPLWAINPARGTVDLAWELPRLPVVGTAERRDTRGYCARVLAIDRESRAEIMAGDAPAVGHQLELFGGGAA